MPDCEKLNNCPFFNEKMPDTKGLGAMYKKKYCQGDNRDCARYVVFNELGKGNVPITLYPNMLDEAKKLIAEAKLAKSV